MKYLNSYNETLTQSELLILERSISPGKAVMKHHSKPKDEKKVKRLISQLGYEYSFVFVFAPAIKGLYPIITHLVENMEMPQEITKESIVYLTISTIGILLQEPKEKYKAIIQKVKDDGLYHLIKPLVTSLKGIKNIFSFIAKRVGKLISTYAEMFAYTALFVPFAMTFKDIIAQENTSLLSILEAFANQGVGKVLSTAVGVGVFGAKHFMEDILDGLKSFKDRGISAVKRLIDKIKTIDWTFGMNKGKEAVVDYVSQQSQIKEMKHIKTFEEISHEDFLDKDSWRITDFDKEYAQRAYDDFLIVKSMFTTCELFDNGYSKNARVNVDEYLQKGFGFTGNAFNDLQECKEYINQLKELGATNIIVTGLPINYGWSEDNIRNGMSADTLIFNAPDEKFEEMAKLNPRPDEWDNFQNIDNPRLGDKAGKIRFWWD